MDDMGEGSVKEHAGRPLTRCWEYLDCPQEVRENCQAYTSRNGKECWMVSEKRCGGGTASRGSIEEKLVECSRCEYYTKVLKKK